jgi:hypothetical protein
MQACDYLSTLLQAAVREEPLTTHGRPDAS